jgi:hypothetical protein
MQQQACVKPATRRQASERVIAACVAALWRRDVRLEACLLKPQMVVQVGLWAQI